SSISFTGKPVRSGLTADVTVDTKSAYILDTIALSPQWIFTGGLRFDDYDLLYEQKNANGTITRLSRSDLLLNYNIGITYKPARNGSLYAAYGTS
ncbi:TonB-dependent receptor, partial [Acinetobacter baumannii]